MKKEELYFYQQVTDFFSQYIEFGVEAYNANGTLTQAGIRAAAKLLLVKRVFVNDLDMKKAAIKSHSIILPDWVFDKGV